VTGTPTADLRRDLGPVYRPAREPVLVDVPELQVLAVDGHGDPNTSPAYAAAVSALFSVSYAARFALKRAGVLEYSVMPLEGLWSVPDMSTFTTADKDAWDWTMLIVQPAEVTPEVVAAAREAVAAKRDEPALELLRLERFAEGRAAQVLHVGPYSEEGPTIAALHGFIAEQGLRLTGRHHEVYLGDPRRSAPERLRTLLRQPVR
jgi:hypothetical protein